MKEIIRKIEESDKLDFETKLLALCKLEELQRYRYTFTVGNSSKVLIWHKTKEGKKYIQHLWDSIKHLC